MIYSTLITAVFGASLAIAAPIYPRDVTLDPAAVAEAQPRDDTATRAFTASEIKTSDGQCLNIDPLSGDFRENLIPITTAACDGSANQQWDIITAGKHVDQPGFANVVSTLTNGCLNFDPRRAAGNQVLLFSCGGRADGGGSVTDSQLFDFTGGAGPLALTPANADNVCLTVNGNTLDQTTCNPAAASGSELFTIGSGGGAAPSTSTDVASTTEAAATTTEAASAPAATKGTTVLDAAAVAEAQVFDATATRAFTGAQVKTSDGQCLSVDANSGDFRENLIPITVGACDGSAGQKFDVITAGKHDNVAGSALIVSSLTNGCVNVDTRRAPGNQVLLFSCGGRADGGGEVTDSQLFPFNGDATTALSPSSNPDDCLTVKNGLVDISGCDAANPAATELFTFVA